MSDAVDARDPARYVQMWSDILSQVLGEISGIAVPTAVPAEAPTDLAPAADTDLWIVVTTSGAIRGEMILRLPAASTVRLAQMFINESASANEATPQHREAVLELFRQIAGLAATAIKSTWGEVQLHLDAAPAAPSWPASLTAWLRIAEEPSALLEVQLSAALVAALRAEQAHVSQPEAVPSAATSATPPTPPAANSAPPAVPDDKVNLDLLMDVELAVTLRFGSRVLPLRDVLDLNPGSVIELDRRVQEPVDMLLDGRVVARGEVVVVEGNYGLRVTEVTPAGV